MRKNWHVQKDLPPSRGEVAFGWIETAAYVVTSMAIAITVIAAVTFLGWVLGAFLSALYHGS